MPEPIVKRTGRHDFTAYNIRPKHLRFGTIIPVEGLKANEGKTWKVDDYTTRMLFLKNEYGAGLMAEIDESD